LVSAPLPRVDVRFGRFSPSVTLSSSSHVFCFFAAGRKRYQTALMPESRSVTADSPLRQLVIPSHTLPPFQSGSTSHAQTHDDSHSFLGAEVSTHQAAKTIGHVLAHAESSKKKSAAKFAWGVLAYNIAVVLWGAFVRASGSGAGCGRHWPLCNGEVVPHSAGTATLIEAAHRATSGLAVIAVIALTIATFRAVPKGHLARRSSALATAFIFGEALIGAGLVLFELVAHDASMKRGLSMVLHLGNTFLLLGALAITAWTLTVPAAVEAAPAVKIAGATAPKRSSPLVRGALALSLLSVLVLGASGAVAALGDTLFPTTSLREGIAQDFSPVAHAFLRLRLLHPVIALTSGVLVLGAAGLVRSMSESANARRFARFVTILFVTQFAAGVLNLSLLAPIGMQIVHLLLADLTWIALVLMASAHELEKGARADQRSAAIDEKGRARDVRGGGRDQVEDGVSDLVDGSVATERNAAL
jgi:heme a synthase